MKEIKEDEEVKESIDEELESSDNNELDIVDPELDPSDNGGGILFRLMSQFLNLFLKQIFCVSYHLEKLLHIF